MRAVTKMSRHSNVFATVCLLLACVRDPNANTPDGGTATNAEGFCDPAPMYAENVAGCQARTDDYQPRAMHSAGDTWPACVSDDNSYHPINPSIPTSARVAAFEDIASRLWKANKLPSVQDFIAARVSYAQDQGLDSRVQRREDVHYPPAPQPCSTAGTADQHPERCVGPAKLLPLLNDAFAKGSLGETPAIHAARVEAALLWFLYVSALSEVVSCATKPQDCDSAWAYYSGGTPRESPFGLARYIQALGAETHARAYDGLLAVRCWRNLDNETGSAANLGLRDRALEQVDRAMLRGVALVARARLSELSCSKGDALQARWTFVKTLVPFLDRAARERDAAKAEALSAAISGAEPEQVDAITAIAALDALFPCP